jgi:hypothetical protein
MIERGLREASDAWFPATPPVAAAARLRLASAPEPSPRRIPRRALVIVLAALVLVGGAVAASVLEVIPGVQIGRVERLPEVRFTWRPLYGRESSLAEARTVVPFTVLLPASLDDPDLVYLDRDRGGAAIVSLVYGGRERARLVLTQWIARSILFDKLLLYDAPTEYVDVGGAAGLWIAGPDHDVFYLGTLGQEDRVGGYLAGNVLVWQRGRVSYRLEANVSLRRALELAGSLRPT